MDSLVSTMTPSGQAAQHALLVMGDLVTRILPLVWIVTGLMGAWLVVAAFMKAAALGGGHGRPGEMKSPMVTGIIGVLMVAMGMIMSVGKSTFFGAGEWNVYEALTPGIAQGFSSDAHAAAVQLAIYRVLQFFGVLCAIRGLLVMKAVGSGQSNATMGHGVTVLVGGILLSNIQDLDEVIISTFGIRF